MSDLGAPGFYHPKTGAWCELRDPLGEASPAQVRWLYRHGYLQLTNRPGQPPSKLECARAIDRARREEAHGAIDPLSHYDNKAVDPTAEGGDPP